MSRTVILDSHPAGYRCRTDSGGLIVTPNPRAAAALEAQFVSLDHLARQTLRRRGWLVASEIVAYRTLAQAVAEVLAPRDVPGMTRVLQPAVRELLRVGPGEPGQVQGRAASLLELSERYRALLDGANLVDPAEVTARAATLGGERLLLQVHGYPRLGWSDLDFLEGIADEGSLLVLPFQASGLFTVNEKSAAYLAERGWVVQRDDREPMTLGEALSRCYALGGLPLPQGVTASAHADMEAEVRFVLTRVKALLCQAVRAEEIVLVARQDHRYGPLVKAVAWEYGVPVRTFYQVPAQKTRLGGWLEHLIGVLRTGGAFEVTVRFLTHPLSEGLSPEVWDEVRRRPPQSLAAWLERLPWLSALAWEARAPRAVYCHHLREVLRKVVVPEKVYQDPQDQLLHHRFTRALAYLSGPETVGLETFLHELAALLALLTVPSDPKGQGVELHTPLSIFGASYRYVFVLGLAEGLLPVVIEDDPALDFHTRRALNEAGWRVESAAEAAKRERLSLWAVLQTAQYAVHLSYPRQAFDQLLVESALFAQLGLKLQLKPTKPCASAEEARLALLLADADLDEVLVHARRAHRVETRREGASPPDEYDGVTGEAIPVAARVFSASQLVAIGQCPYKWFAERVLRLAELEEADADLAPSVRGSLYHRTLELALKQAMAEPDQRAAAREALLPAFEAAERELGVGHLPAWPARREEHLQLLRRVLQSETFIPEGHRVVAVEQRFEALWQGFRVQGVVDRVDRTPEGLVFIDYKTSGQRPKGAKDAGGRASLDVQLPLYLEAAAPALYPDEPVATALYYSLTKAEPIGGAKVKQEALADFATRVKGHLETGTFPVEPDVQGHACIYCAYDMLCRKGPRLDRKRSTHAADA